MCRGCEVLDGLSDISVGVFVTMFLERWLGKFRDLLQVTLSGVKRRCGGGVGQFVRSGDDEEEGAKVNNSSEVERKTYQH